MSNEKLLGIVGSFLVLVGSINAFFLKGIYSELGDVKIQIATVIATDAAKEKRLSELEEWKKDLEKRLRIKGI